MIDQNSQFMAMLTNVGAAKLANANALGLPWKLTALGVGDANGTDPLPSATQTKLINERRRAPLNQLIIDPVNPAVIIAEQVIPEDVGGWWIRELGLYDEDGDLVAVSNCAPSFKPVLSQGSGRTQIVRMNFIVSSTGNIVLKIDPAVVLATREYVDLSIDTVLPSNKVPGTFHRVTIDKRGVVTKGYNPTTLEGYGITDALSLSGGDVDGELRLIGGRSLFVLANESESWAGGVLTKSRDGQNVIGGVGVWGNGNAVRCAFMGLGSSPWASGNGVRVTSAGVDITGVVNGNGAGLTGLKFASLNGLPNSLSGYGVAFATQAEAETGADTNKPMSALRVWQAIAAKVVQATESLLGLTRIATLTQTVAGEDDRSSITPKKLLFGFAIMIGSQGYICFPAWLKGLTIQWGTGGSIAPGASVEVNYPVSYPNAHLMTMVSNSYSSGNTTGSSSLGVAYINESRFRISAVGTSGQPNSPWISIGY
ncbi:phage tail protein [Pseudomonas haemolytica]|uniref:Phage tail protein n=1 Tax=Pseudomonas haemolytica TaxID=2600065 RepID=A0A5P1D7E2_9PSED|nr:phage tail protein [Pseudomonas haemolytica]MRJ36266.1 phage tail protein [Pseudomonas haemolytica]